MSDADPRGPVPAIQISMQLGSFAVDGSKGWEPTLSRARLLDAAGVDRLVVSDHVVFGERLEEYGRPEVGGTAGGKQPTGPDGHWLEPLTTLSVIAGMTTRIRLGTGILLAALRRPVVLAKSASTLDVLSGGRLDLGVGVGWQREEYEAAGLNFDNRGALLNHTLAICQELWREQRASWKSPELEFDGIHMMPKPLQPGGVPFWVSGTVNARVASRLAQFGTGWIPWGPASADIRTGIAQMKDALSNAGHDPSHLQVTGYLPLVKDSDGNVQVEQSMDAVPDLIAAGVTDFRMAPPLPSDEREALEWLTGVVAEFRARS
jgi:probable F420-dependent oxidoreductase